MPDLTAIDRAETAEAAAAELDAFDAEWGKRYPAIGQAWRRAWRRGTLFAFPPAIRKMIYTTNAGGGSDYQDPWQLPDRRGGVEAVVSGDPQCRPPLASAD